MVYRCFFMVSALNISWRTSSSCSRFILARDCVRPQSWFLPHAGPQVATAHFRSQEHGHGTHYRPVSPPRRPCDLWKLFCSSDNCVNNINYCVVVLKCLYSAPRINPGELNWTELKPPRRHHWPLAAFVWPWPASKQFGGRHHRRLSISQKDEVHQRLSR